MTITDHGVWERYTPTTLPAGFPANAMFARRVSDGTDWYAYVHPGTNFTPGNVIICAYWSDKQGSYIVGAAVRDPTAIFPQSGLVHELSDYTGSDPQADLGGKLYDPATGAFSDLPPITGLSARDDFEARLAALEAKQGGA